MGGVEKPWLQLSSVMLLESEAAPAHPCSCLSVHLSIAHFGSAPSVGRRQELKGRRDNGAGGPEVNRTPTFTPFLG